MEIQTVSHHCVALLVHNNPWLTSDSAAALVRSALRRSGLDAWPRMELDIFPSGPGCLILARPAREMIVTVADYVRPFLP